MDIVYVAELSDHWCEYCPNIPKKIYLPFTKSTLNPARICENCAKNFKIVDWFETAKEYYKELNKLKVDLINN